MTNSFLSAPVAVPMSSHHDTVLESLESEPVEIRQWKLQEAKLLHDLDDLRYKMDYHPFTLQRRLDMARARDLEYAARVWNPATRTYENQLTSCLWNRITL